MRILLVDDHILYRDNLKSLLEKQSDLEVVGTAGTARDAVQKSFDLEPDFVLIDILLPDDNGLAAVRKILAQRPKIKVVILTLYESEDLLLSAIRSGAKGYLLKNTPSNLILNILRAVERGEAAIPRAMTSRILDELSRQTDPGRQEAIHLNQLTDREFEVLIHLGRGESNREIAEALQIAENTVKIHVHNVLDKLKFSDRHEAGRMARRLRLNRERS